VRELLAGQDLRPRHVQDFFGLRTWPQVHGPLLHALEVLSGTTRRSINTASENPLFTPAGDGAVVTHHGAFHTAYLVLALDTTLLALARAAHAVQSRVSHLLTDPDNGLPRFLADSGSTGALVAEYVAASALSVVRASASAPSSVQTVSLSAGVEDDATFAGQAVVRLGDAVAAYRRMLAAELFCAVRALRLADRVPAGRLGDAFDAVQALPDGLGQRDLSGDLELAEQLLEDLA
jgi:histidine ammonia-lyase